VAKPAKAGLLWTNPADRWGEGLPTLVTAYTVKALTRVQAAP
jgi:hypothetical protein